MFAAITDDHYEVPSGWSVPHVDHITTKLALDEFRRQWIREPIPYVTIVEVKAIFLFLSREIANQPENSALLAHPFAPLFTAKLQYTFDDSEPREANLSFDGLRHRVCFAENPGVDDIVAMLWEELRAAVDIEVNHRASEYSQRLLAAA